MPRLRYTLKTASEMRGKVWLLRRVTGVSAGCCQERLTENTGIIVDTGVIFFPQCSRAPSERALEGGEVLTGLCRNTFIPGVLEGRAEAAERFGSSVFLFFFPDLYLKNNTHYFPLFLMAVCFLCVCTALTEPGQLPLGSHGAA